MDPPPSSCCDFFFRTFFGVSFGHYRRVSNPNDPRVTVILHAVGADGRVVEQVGDLPTLLRCLKEESIRERRQEKEWRTGQIMRHVHIPANIWERDQTLSTTEERGRYLHVKNALEGYKRNKLALHQFLAILDSSIKYDVKFHEEIISRLPWHDFMEMARANQTVERDGDNALHWALFRGAGFLTAEDIQQMLQLQPGLASQTTKRGELPIHIAANTCSRSPDNNSLPILQQIIQAYPRGLGHIDEMGRTPLQFALLPKQKRLETIRIILEAYPAALSMKDRLGQNALHVAVSAGEVNMNVVHYLLDKETTSTPMSNLLVKERTKKAGLTPLHTAVFWHPSNTELIQFLLSIWPDGAKEITRSGRTSLHFAVGSKEATLDNVGLIYAAWPDAIRFRDSGGLTPIHISILASAPMNVISFLLDNSSDSVFSEQVMQYSMLHLIMIHPKVNVDIARRIYDAYPAAIREANNGKGYLPLHMALDYGANEDVVRFLLEKWQGSVRVIAANGLTALHLAVNMISKHKARSSEQVEGICDQERDDRPILLLEEQALLDGDIASLDMKGDSKTQGRQDRNKSPPSKLIHVGVVKLIFQRWPDAIKIPASSLRVVPILGALLSGAPLDVVRYLYEEWPESLKCTSYLLPPLHAAMASRAEVNVVKFLIEQNPSCILERTSMYGDTPLHVGVSNNAPLECISLLLEKCGPECAARMRSNGDLLIHSALKARADIEVIACLVDAWPRALLEQDCEGIYPRDYALLYPRDVQPHLERLLTLRR